MKKGISLIVLVITIIVMIILASAIILTLNDSGIINRANEAVEATNLQEIKQIASLAWSEAYLDNRNVADEETKYANIKAAVDKALENIDVSGYDIVVEEKGVTVTPVLKAGLHDANGKMLASWDELVNTYGLDTGITYYQYPRDPYYKTATTSAYYILNNYESLAAGVNLVIDESITTIGEGAFLYCASLESVTMPDDVTSLESQNTFAYCTNLKNIKLSNNLTSIPSNAFNGCASLINIDMPAGVTDIGAYAFKDCTSLTSFDIPVGVTRIAMYTFAGCTSLTSVNIPAGVTSIISEAFNGCTSLTIITFEGTVEQWNAITFSNALPTDVPATEVVCSNGTVTLK